MGNEKMYSKVESKNLEFKEAKTNSYLKTVSAFSNYRDGDIVFGVKDNSREIIGISNPEKLKLDIENAINDNISPHPVFTLFIEEIEGKKVVVLHVIKGVKPPYFYKRQAYQRQNTTTIEVDNVELQQLILKGSNISYEDMPSEVNEKLSFELLKEKLASKNYQKII
jgi:ATP-dependent DNA helicase RecG